MSKLEKRREKMGLDWTESVAEMQKRKMLGKGSTAAYRAIDERFGDMLFLECDASIVVPEKYTAKAPRPPRGRSTNPGHKDIYNEN